MLCQFFMAVLFLFLPEHNAMQEEASPGNFLITTTVRLFVGVFMMEVRQT